MANRCHSGTVKIIMIIRGCHSWNSGTGKIKVTKRIYVLNILWFIFYRTWITGATAEKSTGCMVTRAATGGTAEQEKTN